MARAVQHCWHRGRRPLRPTNCGPFCKRGLHGRDDGNSLARWTTISMGTYASSERLDPSTLRRSNMPAALQVLDAAMALNRDQRAELAHKLLLSLEPDGIDEDADQAWAAEIRRRLLAIRDGQVALRDWDEALLRVRQATVG